jgi:multisubunit Na+/H+ antiporter MnhB subunit
MNERTGMSLIVKTITRLTVGLILMYGLYIVLHGHLSPGGGFAGGVIIALAFVHLMLAYGKDVALAKLGRSMASVLESVGALLFLLIALGGLIGGSFFLDVYGTGEPFRLFSAHMVLFSNLAICLKVGVGLFAVIVGLVAAGSGSAK